MRRRARIAAAASIAAIVAGACSSSAPVPDRSAAATPTSGQAVASPTPARDPDEPSTRPEPAAILGFSAPLLAGGQLEGSSLEGRDVALWFWAPW